MGQKDIGQKDKKTEGQKTIGKKKENVKSKKKTKDQKKDNKGLKCQLTQQGLKVFKKKYNNKKDKMDRKKTK